MEKRYGLEDSLFSWDGWDDNGIMSPQFYKVELKVPIGPFPVGKQFAVAVLDGDKSLLTFIEEDETSHTFEVALSMGRLLSENEVKDCYGHSHCDCGEDHE